MAAASAGSHQSSVWREVGRCLLMCGAAYALVFVVAYDVIAASMFEGYNRLDQVLSALFAVGAPSQGFIDGMVPVFAVLMLGFAIGIWLAVGDRPAGKVLAVSVMVVFVTGPLWLLFPMTSRADRIAGISYGGDFGHQVLSIVSVLLILLQLAVSAWLLRGWFTVFSLVLLALCLASYGTMTALILTIPLGEPTPYLGFVERAGFGTWFLWMTVLGIVLWRRTSPRRDARLSSVTPTGFEPVLPP